MINPAQWKKCSGIEAADVVSPASAFAAAHPDLYELGTDSPRLTIRAGQIAIGSPGAVGYASGALPDFDTMERPT
jgi:hypothetical protein